MAVHAVSLSSKLDVPWVRASLGFQKQGVDALRYTGEPGQGVAWWKQHLIAWVRPVVADLTKCVPSHLVCIRDDSQRSQLLNAVEEAFGACPCPALAYGSHGRFADSD